MSDSPFRILVVDDHPETARVLERLLTLDGYIVKSAQSSATALVLANAERFNLLISDISMPGADGRQLLHIIQESYPIDGIALSAYTTPADVEQNLAAGFRAHFSKPFDMAKLRQAIHSIRNGTAPK